MYRNPFSDAELDRRLAAVRAAMARRRLDMLLLSSPENIFYLTGLDHWGYFAPHLLIVPAAGEMTLITRAMEAVTIARQVRNARFLGHSDSETAIAKAVPLLAGAGRLGIEAQSAGFSYAAGQALSAALPDLPDLPLEDVSGLIDRLRLVKSAEEQALMRQAGKVSSAAMAAALEALAPGVPEREVAAACSAAMIRAGGDPPGFGPFLRPGRRLAEEHTTWGDSRYRGDDRVLLELAGCVGRYHAPMGRLVHLGPMPDADAAMAEIAHTAFDAVVAALTPGARAREVYGAWQAVVDAAGLPEYRRHHCGYAVGIGVPPSWTGGNSVTGLRHDSEMEIETGMSFHILSWFTETGRGEFFTSDCVLLGPNGAEVLTHAA
ncbi:M24 family metallopeptidase [Acidimangrovimonas pyrenivorans]|uniref:M24 family metallopeptidase n=1 Tax=Acidimangrovimonas pyrenivorans TaxID=2030798 RepID=A0ABV7AEE4_9RHOB